MPVNNNQSGRSQQERQSLLRRKCELESDYRSLLGDSRHISGRMLRVVRELLQTKNRLWEIEFQRVVRENLDLELAMRLKKHPVLQPLGPHRRN